VVNAFGGVAEWSNAADFKSAQAVASLVGSNPTASAKGHSKGVSR
jgi:hypothetical protein